jgi:hypothetical protein
MRHWCLPVVLTLALLGCQSQAQPTAGRPSAAPLFQAPDGTSDVAAVNARAKSGVKIKVGTITGKVKAPGGFKPGSGAPKENEALPAIKPGDKNAAAGDQPIESKGLASVEVFLASRKGVRYAGPSVGKTDAEGNFVIKNVPEDLTFLLMTDTLDPGQRHTEICGLARQIGDGQPFELTLSSSIVTMGAINMPSAGHVLGAIDWGFYFKMIVAVDAKLKSIKLKDVPDLNDPQSIQNFLANIQLDGVPLNTAMGGAFLAGLNTGIDAKQTQDLLNRIGQIQLSGQGSVTTNGQTQSGGGTVLVDPSQLGGLDLSGFGIGEQTATDAAPAEESPASSS